MSVLVMVMVVSFIGSFQIFDTIVVATDGGPVNSTRAINFYIFEQVFEQYKIGYGAAMATLLLLFLAVFSLIQMRIARANESDLSNALVDQCWKLASSVCLSASLAPGYSSG